ncbi:MAG: hypothetical protein QOF84_3334 [Streptomyces sp.]|jgi:hypothetical protein|nr:hypothetical protein [Streptomyces sp.]MDX6348544.1 hypothetical protein [Streptomyces sp.]
MCSDLVNSYIGDMASAMTSPVRGSSALGPDSVHRHLTHLLGTALRAIGIFADTVFRVVLLGSDGTPPRRQASSSSASTIR